MPLLQQYERVRAWCAPVLLRVPDNETALLAERMRLEAKREALATTTPPKALSL